MKKINTQKLKRSFFERSTIQVAKDLIGCFLVNLKEEKPLIGKITETEAYIGAIDSASHTYKKRTPRTEVQYGKPGIAYTYLVYGIHTLFCVVTEPKGQGSAVLIRSLEPIKGQEIMIENRKLKKNILQKHPQKICSGPGILSQAFDFNPSLSGQDLCSSQSKIFFQKRKKDNIKIGKGKRIGIDYAQKKDINRLWRFYLKGSSYLSN
jgi:DNA-3-methyladenine glycosylase